MTDQVEVDTIAAAAGLDEDQTRKLRSLTASWRMENLTLSADVIAAGAEIIAGRLTSAEYRATLSA